MGILILIARILFAALFIQSGVGHLTATDQMSGYASSKGIPAPKFMVLLSGLMLLLGGFSILLGWWVRVGALLLVLFLLPTAFTMHNFWTVEDPESRQNEMIHFMKDLSLAGAAFLIWYLYVNLPEIPLSIS